MRMALLYFGTAIKYMRSKYNNDEWTPARFNSFIKSALRAASRRWGPKYRCIANAYVDTRINGKSGRQAKHYRCANCDGAFPAKDVQVDHITPIIDPAVGFTTWDDVIDKMFCEQENLQCLCSECHKVKTAQERTTKRKTNAG